MEDDRLLIPGAVVDGIKATSDQDFAHPRVQHSQRILVTDLESRMWKAVQQVVLCLPSQDLGFDELVAKPNPDALLETVIKGDELFDILTQEDDPDTRAVLRDEYDSYVTLKLRGAALDPEQILGHGAFWLRVGEVGWGTRLCSTTSGRIGLVPARTEAGDKVVVFEGCPIAWVLRMEERYYESDEDDDFLRYCKLVGRGYFCPRGQEIIAYDEPRAADMIVLG